MMDHTEKATHLHSLTRVATSTSEWSPYLPETLN
jgi:hypothetical protein